MTDEKIRTRLPVWGALVAALVVASLGAVSLHRKVLTFQPLGFEVTRSQGQWLVSAVSDPRTHLEVGDQIILVNGEIPTDRSQLREALRKFESSGIIVQRGSSPFQTVEYRRPPLDVDTPYLILALTGVLYLLVGLYTLLRVGNQTILFFLWCLASSVVYLFTPTPPVDSLYRTTYVLEDIARVFVPPLTLHFFLLFPNRVWKRPWFRPLIPFLYLPASVLLVLRLDLILQEGRWLTGPPTANKIQSLDRGDLYLMVLFGLASVVVLLIRLAQGGEWEERRQSLWVALGMAGGYLPFLFLNVVPTSLGLSSPEPVTVLSVLPLTLVPVSFAYAILRYRLWDMAVIVRDALTYTLTLLLGVFGFSILQLLITRGVPEDFSVARNLLSFGAVLLMAGLMIPTKQGISATLERVQYRSTFSKRRALADLGRELLHERDLDRLSGGLLQELRDAMPLEQVNLYLAESGGLVPCREQPGLPSMLDSEALGPDFWDRDYESISGVALPATQLHPAQELYRLGYRYAFPLRVRGNRVGLLIASYKLGEMPLNSDDVDLIRQLLNQAALAIENAQLIEQQQRQLEEVLELKQFTEGIIEASPAGIAVLDANQRIVLANMAFAALAGVDRGATRRRRLADLLPLDELPSPDEGLIEVSYLDHQKRERHLQLSTATFLYGTSEKLDLLVVHDVSERVEMERALKEKDRLAALGVMAAGVAHEVNTPLTGISSYVQMLLAETDKEDVRHTLLKKVERQTFRAARIVNNLLDFARQRTDAPCTVDLASLLNECLELFAERMDERGVHREWTSPERTVLTKGNEGELHQVFSNLMLNALEAMSDSGGTLTVRLHSEGTWACVDVQDTGPGIPVDQLDQIFQPFFSTKLGNGGTGLGLSISYEIVRRHGGEMSVRNAREGGCCFLVKLPLVPSTTEDTP